MRRSLTALVVLAAACSSAPADQATIDSTVAATDSSETATVATASPTIPTTPVSSSVAGSETTSSTVGASLVGLAYERIDSDVRFPIFMAPLPGTDLSVIAAKEGTIWLYDGVDVHGEAFLDISGRVRNDGEQGLLGVEFAADHAVSGRFFAHYTAGNGDTVLSEFVADGLAADAATETELFRVAQPAANHNGGMIQLGPDGFLYMALGDGGAANDRFDNGQDGSTTLGSLLRFDVSVPGLATPAGAGFDAPEVWSIGLRNPWRFTIDDDAIVIADVGQDAFEEINIARLSDQGVNYGWPVTEGMHCFRPARDCDIEGLTLPAIEVAHGDEGTCSITGGLIYRGQAIPELDGHYFFSDFCGGYLRSIADPLSAGLVDEWTEMVGRLERVTSFGFDLGGEIHVLTADGDIFKVVPVRG